MLNKRIKSLLVAGLLVMSMSGNVFADFIEPDVSNIDPNASEYMDNGFDINITNISGFAKFDENGEFHEEYHPDNTYSVIIDWNEDEIIINENGIVAWFTDGNCQPLDYTEGKINTTITLPEGVKIKTIGLNYRLGSEQEPTISFDDAEQKVINKYRESMAAVGVLNNGERQIDTSFMIEKDAWLDFIEGVNGADNYVTIEEGEEKGEYHVYTNVSGEKKLIEVIFIDFFESDSKGWVPGITPGTGQALAVGGIVIGAAAAVGLLVNNRKKDEE